MLAPPNRARRPYDDAAQVQPRSLAAATAMRQGAASPPYGPPLPATAEHRYPPSAGPPPSPFAPTPRSLAAYAAQAQMTPPPHADELQEPWTKPLDEDRRKRRPDFGFGTMG